MCRRDSESSGAFNLKEAATFTREESGKIRLNNKGYVAGWKGGGIGLGVGIIFGAPLAFAAIGGLLGYMSSDERRDRIHRALSGGSPC